MAAMKLTLSGIECEVSEDWLDDSQTWLLKYEAWSDNCLTDFTWNSEDEARDIAANQARDIQSKWIPETCGEFILISEGHNPNMGQYGVTWALYKKTGD